MNSIFVLAAMLAPAQDADFNGKTLKNGLALVRYDWRFKPRRKPSWVTFDQSERDHRTTLVLSLAPGPQWHRGKAWLWMVQVDSGYQTRTVSLRDVHRGKYALVSSDHSGVQLHVAFTTKFSAVTGRYREFEHFPPVGLLLDIELGTEGLDPRELEMMVKRAYYVNSRGEEDRRARPVGFTGTVLQPETLSHSIGMYAGSTITARKTLLQEDLPADRKGQEHMPEGYDLKAKR